MQQREEPSPFNLPNALTAARLVAAPLLALAVYLEPLRAPMWLAPAIVAVAAVTDFADGAVARAMKRTSAFGAMLDPIADKIFIVTALFVAVSVHAISGPLMWAALLIVWRELTVSELRGASRAIGRVIRVAALSKWKTAIQFIAVFSLFASRNSNLYASETAVVGFSSLWIAAALSVYTGWGYLSQTWRRS